VTTAPVPDLEQELVNDIYEFRFDPLGFVKYAYDWEAGELSKSSGPRTWQAEMLTELGEHLANPETRYQPFQQAIASGHGIGKSADVAFIIHWAMSCYEDARIVVTANTGDQLATKTVPEAKKWFRRGINTHWFITRSETFKIKDPTHADTWRADFVTWSIEKTEAFAGLHNEGKIIVLIFDEASAIPDKIWEVAEGALTDEDTVIIWLAYGNPTQNTGRFRECFGKLAHRWKRKQIDSRTVEGTNKDKIKQWEEDYGEDSDFFRVRVRGEFPRSGAAQFISSEQVAKARRFAATAYDHMPRIGSCDVARFGDDQTVLGDRQGRKARIIKKVRGLSITQTSNLCADYIDREHPDAFVIDADGLGAGVFDDLKSRNYHLKTHLVEFHGGGTPKDEKKYYNKRAEVWGDMRDWFDTSAVQIPDDAELDEHLTAPTFDYARGKRSYGSIILESKDDMKERLPSMGSPDCGDMLAMTFAVSVVPKPKSNYSEPPPRMSVWG
jgi:hypothetical protein